MMKRQSPTAARAPSHAQSPAKYQALKRGRRHGVALLETLIAAGAVLTMLGVVAPLVIRSARLWKQTQHYQFATDELSGQMDRLLSMSADDRNDALEQLSVSPAIQDVLHEATLIGKRVSDIDGTRIELSIDWQRVGPAKPITLVAWIDPRPGPGQSDERADTDEADDQ